MYAQDYQINFTGTGATSTVDSVKVENLSQCTSLSLGGADTLHLKATKYHNGSDIPNVADSAAWGNLTTGATAISIPCFR